ncbi:hypothetical protein [Aquibacillus sediminis]|uniref:hypothetical protein n=1 Tax=Aquibacillus sediminis TaxID=2574734 RepID=UPI00319EA944
MTFYRFFVFMLLIVILTGCMYPEENLTKNQIPNEVQLQQVQDAIDRYVENNNGRVPIRTKPSDTPIFQKYIIDFEPLKQQSYISDIPGIAFENGGFYQYVLVTPENDPTVKLIDLRTTEVVRSVRNRINIYRSENTYPPFGEEVGDGVYEINYEKIGLDEPPYVVSPYSQKSLPVVMDVNGEAYIDYRIDLYQVLEEHDHTYESGDDIRWILANNHPFVPAYSLPYTLEDNEPVFKNN